MNEAQYTRIAFVNYTPIPTASTSKLKCRRRPRLYRTDSPCFPPHASIVTENDTAQPPSATRNASPPLNEIDHSSRMFSNVEPGPDGNLVRVKPSELGCTALVAGTMIGAGVLALPTVAAPAGFVPSSAALLGVWAYMAATGMLISEVTINTACALGRPKGVSLLSLGQLTLGRTGAIVTAAFYTLLHYAILTAYVSQGGLEVGELLSSLASAVHFPLHLSLPPYVGGVSFAGFLGGLMYSLSSRRMEMINNGLVAGVLATFAAVVGGAAGHLQGGKLLEGHWSVLPHGQLIPVLFVSCVYHNVVATITMRLEGDRRKIRQAIILGSAIPVGMFLVYDAAILGTGASSGADHVAVAAFSVLAIATSFVGFVEGLTELWADVRQTVGREGNRWQDYVATLSPPVFFAGASPDIFLNALDAAGTYGIAVLFGALPAAMAWRNRRDEITKDFKRVVGGGDGVLGLIAAVPAILIGSRLLEHFNGGL